MSDLSESFRKDPEEERFLARLNDVLLDLEVSSYRDVSEVHPIVHVVGVPRSGTTLAVQLLARHLSIGYINNLIAAFWKAPTVGIRLSRKLLGERPSEAYESTFGRTFGLEGPHEFGYFWRDLLGYDELSDTDNDASTRIDWNRVACVLTNMTLAFGGPIVFKSFGPSMHAAAMQAALPKTCFVRVRRDPIDNALSLLSMRREFAGSVNTWTSMKPREYGWLKDTSVPVQLAGQVFFLERMLDRQLACGGGRNVLDVEYASMCKDPRSIVNDVQSLLRENGCEVARVSEPPDEFDVRRPSQSAASGLVDDIRQAFEALRTSS